ncbi:MAG: BMP family ABC transporter substrate-binding protein [Erysipelotrichaceae bacterium]|nr:BMP family ABC transporter substrate-binding protein [Erysipelotrichaceae bacterium]
MKKLLKIALVMLLAVSMVACNNNGGGEQGGKETDVVKVAVLLPFTGDNSYFDTLARGVKRANSELAGKAEVKLFEVGNTTEKATWDAAFDEVCEDGEYALVISGNNSYEQFMFDAATRYPDQKFMNFDFSSLPAGMDKIPENVYCVTYALDDLGYVVGALAAQLTQTGKVGVVVGMNIQPMDQFIGGFCQILKDQGVEYFVRYVDEKSTTPFQDEGAGYEITKDLMKLGADVIWQVAGGTGNGVIRACAEDEKVWAIGVDQDQYEQFKDSQPDWAKSIVSSALKNTDVALIECVKLVLDGKFDEKLGTQEAWGIALNGVGLAENDYYKEQVSAEIQQAVADTLAKVTSGEVTVVDTMEMSTEEWQTWHDANTK